MKIKAARALHNLRQEDVAKYLGISLTQYRDKENGKYEFTLIEIKKLLELFNVKFEELF